jgi:hypothetical protein
MQNGSNNVLGGRPLVQYGECRYPVPASGVVDEACAGGLGQLGHPQRSVPASFSVSYSAGQQPFEPVPPRLSYTRSGETHGTASRDHLCVITGSDLADGWSRRSPGAGTTY